MDLAISPTTPGLTAAERTQLCAAVEAMGVPHAWLAEVAGPESFSFAGAVLSQTTSMEVGIAVVAAGTRTPALLAMGAATLSQLGSGRTLRLGIGSSSEVIMEQWHGASFDRPLGRVRQHVEATRAALAGERDYDGDLASMARFRLDGEPSGAVPLYVGALNAGMLRLGGQVGDGVCLNMMAPDVVPRQLAEVSAGASHVGRSLPADFGVMARLHWVPGDPAAGREVIRHAFGPYFAQPVYNRFLGWSGYPEEAAHIAAAFAEGDRAGVAAGLTDEIVDGIALLGSAADAAARLEEFATAGVTVGAVSVIAPGFDDVLAAWSDLTA